jgi:hypothetical protein
MRKAYKFCIYENPKPHEELERLRWENERGFRTWSQELSREELTILHPHLVGRPAFFEHLTNASDYEPMPFFVGLTGPRKSWGFISKTYQDPLSGSIYVWIVPHDTIEGRLAARQLETEHGAKGCSLQHTRHLINNWAQMNEVSLCKKGVREGTWFIGDETIPLEESIEPPSPTTTCYENVAKIDLSTLFYMTNKMNPKENVKASDQKKDFATNRRHQYLHFITSASKNFVFSSLEKIRILSCASSSDGTCLISINS